MAKVKIDLDRLSAAISKYDEVIEEFEQSVSNTEKAINLLQNSGWKSGASTAYFMMYQNTWKQNMEKRIKIIQHLRECLNKAQQEYTVVYEELQQIDSVL